MAAALAVAGIALGVAIAPGLGVLACGYLALTASYSLWLRRVVVLDILVVAAGFVIRALAGGVATDIYLSRWFVIVTACCAVFLVAAKRYAELRAHAGTGPARATLRRYSLGRLRLTLAASATAAAVGLRLLGVHATRPRRLVRALDRPARAVARSLRDADREGRRTGAGGADPARSHAARSGLTWGVLFLGGVYVGPELSARAPLAASRVRSLSGWGRTTRSRCRVVAPHAVDEVLDALASDAAAAPA